MNAQKIPTRQQGAALVIVLALLAGSLMIGVSGMQSSLIDERLAGNYRAAALAQMNAERAASQGSSESEFRQPAYWSNEQPNRDLNESLGAEDNWKEIVKGYDYNNLKNIYENDVEACDDGDEDRCFFFPVYISSSFDESGNYLVAMGAVENSEGDLIAESLPIFVEFSLSDDAPAKGPGDYEGPGFSSFSPVNFFGDIRGSSWPDSKQFFVNHSSGPSVLVEKGQKNAVNIPDKRKGNYSKPGDGDVVEEYDGGEELSEIDKLRDFADKNQGVDNIFYESGNYTMEKKVNFPNPSMLVVNGDFDWKGNNDFQGIIIVLGNNISFSGGGGGELRGAIVHYPKEDGSGERVSNFDFSGGGNFEITHDATVLDELQSSLSVGSGNVPYEISSWQ